VHSVQVSPVANPYKTVRFRGRRSDIPNRKHSLVRPDEISPIGAAPSQQLRLLRDDGDGIDLWSSFDAVDSHPDSCVFVHFRALLSARRDLIIGIGVQGEAFLFVNNHAVGGTVGPREFARNQLLFHINAANPECDITLVCRRPQTWTEVPEQHDRPPWRLAIEMFDSPVDAAATQLLTNFHILDTPIVPSVSDICVECPATAGSRLELLNTTGAVLCVGDVLTDGTVKWSNGASAMSNGICFVKAQTGVVEPVLITGGRELDSIWAAIARTGNPWELRATHMLKPEFLPHRNVWWERNFVLAFAMCTRAATPTSAELAMRAAYPSGAVSIEQYVSHIDGTRQFFRRFSGQRIRNAPMRSRRTLIVIPAVAAPVRPYLQSPEVANLHETEDLVGLANEFGIDIIWPGVATTDYGGDFSVEQLKECLNAAHCDISDAYLLGTCSSGITALSFAETHAAAGVLLLSPIIERHRHNWLNGIYDDWVTFPTAVLASERVLPRINSLIPIPVYLDFSINMPGHGSAEQAHELCNSLVERKGDVTQRWPRGESDFLWGERWRNRVSAMMLWIQDKARISRSQNIHSVENHTSPTAEQALIKGFRVLSGTDPTCYGWLNKWRSAWTQIRGEPWKYVSEREKGLTLVQTRILATEDVAKLRRGWNGYGAPQLISDTSQIGDNDVLWGYRTVVSGAETTIEVVRSATATSGPDIDLMADGCCRAAVWKQSQEGTWSLVQVWL